METFTISPSFARKTYTVRLGETLTLTDSNGSLSKYKVTADTANVTVAQSGNTLKITPKSSSNASGSLRLKYQISPSYSYASLLFSAPYLQDVLRAGISDPKAFNVNLNVELQGQGEIIKVDENGKGLAGAQFEIKNKKRKGLKLKQQIKTEKSLGNGI